MSRKLATAVAGVTALLWIVALRYGNFSRKAQRTYQDALAETNQVRVAKLNEQYLGAGRPQHSREWTHWLAKYVVYISCLTQTTTTATAAQICSLFRVRYSYFTLTSKLMDMHKSLSHCGVSKVTCFACLKLMRAPQTKLLMHRHFTSGIPKGCYSLRQTRVSMLTQLGCYIQGNCVLETTVRE